MGEIIASHSIRGAQRIPETAMRLNTLTLLGATLLLTTHAQARVPGCAAAGLSSGSKPSATNIRANAPSSTSHTFAPFTASYFFAPAVPGAAVEPRIALKNSLVVSTTMMSDLLRKLER
mgnify:CR=1 FL=1